MGTWVWVKPKVYQISDRLVNLGLRNDVSAGTFEAKRDQPQLKIRTLIVREQRPSTFLFFAFVYVSFEEGRQWMSNWMSFSPPLQEPRYNTGFCPLLYYAQSISFPIHWAPLQPSFPPFPPPASSSLHRILRGRGQSVAVVGISLVAESTRVGRCLRLSGFQLVLWRPVRIKGQCNWS